MPISLLWYVYTALLKRLLANESQVGLNLIVTEIICH